MERSEIAGGRYRTLLELGQGGSAIVHLGVAQGPGGFNKLVVLKSLKRSLCADHEFRTMFLNEARLSARLNHRNVVQVLEIVSDEGAPVIVMEYLEGRSLSELRMAAGNRLSRDAELRIISEGLRGLHYAHELRDFDGTPLGVVHRDVTPHNLFITYDGQIKILDFGIAKLNCSLVETQTGVIKGKLRYMPPEQIAGESVDRRVDVFAAGVMLWEAACGQRMWAKLSDAAIMNAILRGDTPPPSRFDPSVPEELERIIMKALEYEREDRYPTVQALREELEAYLVPRAAPSPADIGQIAGEMFAEAREHAQNIIEQKLRAASFTNDSGEYPMFDEEVSTSSTAGYVTDRTLPDQPRKARRGVWVGAMAAALGIMLAVIQLGANRPPAEAAPKTAVQAEEELAKTAEPEVTATIAPAPEKVEPTPEPPVRVSVRVSPEHAKLTLDGRPLEGNPFQGEFDTDGKEHVVRATAPGYLPAEKTVSFDRDHSILLDLKAKPHARRELPTSSKPAAKPTAPPAPPATPAASCSPPYYVDSEGLKRYKPQCL